MDVIPQKLDFAIGIKQTGGEYQDELALIVLIPEKLPRDQVPADQLIPAEFEGFRTDVVQFRPTEIADTSPHDPLLGGIQISRPAFVDDDGNLRSKAGTLGAMARNRSDGAMLMLTNCHVLPDAGVDVHQPADLITGHRVVGTSDRGVSTNDWLDCAVAVVGEGQAVSAAIADIGPVAGTTDVTLWQQVTKRGAQTGVTSGLVVSVIPDLSEGMIIGMIIDTFPFGSLFCWHGDSGSVILNLSGEVVGLLFAMDDEQCDPAGTPLRARGLASTIGPVLDALQIDIEVSP
ncbi:trypsin-like peptidase domain-containing protein [Micromonospora sp. 4G57]|uniref:Trypsin-like peptidase domain-containing protein n=1 Tax=Micromonospora sicca TaxID=2202420 RepID=A0ABU5JQK5_9ACTN|nr:MULTISPECIES: trypsin-like peptidase domain-containing protein [unclassified Micromonospora]MDZ5447568.1 trypsin-like peptidase domain-containing protein [Micromonospora sp. 4G57]MDZ5494684.1 trypsin-like peptidase domain-containing protein [Micromonospora sp. 4G53]